MAASLSYGSIIRTLGNLILVEAGLLAVPLIVCILYSESDWVGFAFAAAAALAVGSVTEFFTRKYQSPLRSREGFLITAVIWVVFAFFGVIPFMLSSHPLGFCDAFFEVISGLTTTGASIITDIDSQSHGILFWRAFLQWIGGLGIILFMLAALPELNKGNGISMFQAEATGITHSKLHPRIRQTALSIWGVYSLLTIVSIVLLYAGPMNLFDSVCQTFAAVATGGFTTHNQGIAYWNSSYIYIILTVIMFVAGMNFILLYTAAKKGFKSILHNDVFKAYALIVMAVYIVMLANALAQGFGDNLADTLIYPLFHIVSAITSTGFGAPGAESWGTLALLFTFFLMYVGACAGSTTGGMKIDRILVMYRNTINQIKKTISPKHTYLVRLNGVAIDRDLISRISGFASLYLLLLFIITGIIAAYGYNLTDSAFIATSCLGCNGLGYGATGAGGSFASLPDTLKYILSLVMLIGRLELFAYIVLLLPSFWKR